MDIYKVFEEIESRPNPKTKHPYAGMSVGDIVPIDEDRAKMQMYAHTYARATGKKFLTRTINGVLHVKRIQ